jgi:hypothetical protein
MKNLRFIVVVFSLVMLLSSCSLWNNLFRPKYGCPSNGKNVGAEKILSGDPDAAKSVKKARKFRS